LKIPIVKTAEKGHSGMGQMVQVQSTIEITGEKSGKSVPAWVPRSVQNYIDHTEMGIPIRALAREQGCHASTVLRQIRRVETLRDDPLVDNALKNLGGGEVSVREQVQKRLDSLRQAKIDAGEKEVPNIAELSAHGNRVLKRLCETGAVLAVAADMDKAVIVRDGNDGENTRTGVVDRTIAEAMALKGWISAPEGGRISRYQITSQGRSALADIMARDENEHLNTGLDASVGHSSDVPSRARYGVTESPLSALARRRDRDGTRFLTSEMVRAGERLREDFEIAQMGAEVARNWESFLQALRPASAPASVSATPAIQRAHARVIDALVELGPGLSDVTLRCCCFLEGLETAEKVLGWSARSGKIVLRIALMRLQAHYADASVQETAMIG